MQSARAYVVVDVMSWWLACLWANQTYRDLKDRQLLLGYRGKVERGSAEERKIDELLNNSVRRRSHLHHRFRLHVTERLFFFSFSKSGGRTDDPGCSVKLLNERLLLWNSSFQRWASITVTTGTSNQLTSASVSLVAQRSARFDSAHIAQGGCGLFSSSQHSSNSCLLKCK